VVYRADALADEVDQLFSAPSDASAPPVLVSGAMVAGGDVRERPSSADPDFLFGSGGRVLYYADAEVDGTVELFSAPLDASAPPIRLSAVAPGRNVQGLRVSADGSRAAYRAVEGVDTVLALYAVPSAGGQSVKINRGFPGVTGDARDFRLSAD